MLVLPMSPLTDVEKEGPEYNNIKVTQRPVLIGSLIFLDPEM